MSERFHIITGGPGSGKSTLIEALAAEGFSRPIWLCARDCERSRLSGSD
ncbi:AAA family ATPase [Sphingomonas melonis]